MRKCDNCKNLIPEDMKICPHCGLLPPTLYPQFFLYAALTVIALICAVYFRPFAGGTVIGSASSGVLWAAFVIFLLFALVFLAVAVILLRAYRNRSFKQPLTKAERARFIRMKQHIESGHHYYEDGKYCSVCGHKK